MANYVQLPDGSLFPAKEGENYADTIRAAYAKYPEAFGGEAIPTAQPQGGFVPALKAGISGVKSAGAALAGRTGLMDLERAKKIMEEEEAYQKRTFKPTEEGWLEAPVTKTKELLGGSLPYMAAPLAAAALAPEAAIPLGIAGLTTTGATLAGVGAGALQYTGTGLARQVQEGKKLEETNLGAAAAASVPTAILDRLSFGMIPGIRNIFGQAGKTLTTAEAKAFVEQGLRKTAADYALATGKALSAEGLTEAAQQFLERAQAGLSLTDEKARDEYWDSLVGGAVLGGVLAPAGRYIERGGEQAKARKIVADEQAAQKAAQRQQAEAQAKQAAADEAARKQTPEYAQEVKAKYDEALAQFKQLRDAAKNPGKDAEPVLQEAYKQAKKDFDTFKKESMQPIAQEYSAIRSTGIYDKIAEQERVAGLTPMDYLLENAQQVPAGRAKPAPMPTPYGIQPTSPEMQRFKGTQQQALTFAQNQITAANDQRLTDQKSLPEQVADYTQYLLTQPKQAAYLAANRMRLPGLTAKQNDAVLENVLLALDMGRAAGKYDASFNLTTPEQQFATTQAAPALGAEAEEQGVLEQTAQEKEAAAREAARQEKIRPEQYALQQMQQKAGRSVMGLPGFGVEKEPLTPSPAMGRMQQQLLGIPLGEDLIHTAGEVDTTQPKVQKGPGGGFRLFNERGERQLTDEQAYRNLSERLAIAASNPDLSDEAYDFLRRAETVLPKVNTRLEETRQERVKYGEGPLAKASVARDTAAGESFYKLLDEQLARIERGEEGVHRGQRYLTQEAQRARGSAAEITPPTEAMPYDIERNKQATPSDLRAKQRIAAGRKTWPNNLPFEQPAETERRLANVPGAEREKIVRATTGRTLRGQAPALSLRDELEPLIRQQEQVAGEGPLARGQGELFPAEAEKLGYAKMNRAGFVAFMKSKVVQKMRDAVNKDKIILAKAKTLPALKAKVDSLAKQLETMQAKNLEYSKAASILYHARGLDKLGKDRAAANETLVDMEINRAQLAGRIEELMQLRGLFDQQVEKYGDFRNTELAARFEPLLSEYNKVQQELASLNTDLATLDAGMKEVDNLLRVEKARNALARLNPETVSKETIAKAKEALRAAQLEAGIAESQASKVEQTAKEQAAREARAAEAVRLAEAEKQRIDLGKERQRRLEAAYGTSSTGQEYEFITVAQRMAQEMEPVETTVKRGKRVLSNPNQVLAGYRSRITAIEREMMAAFNKSRDARDSFLIKLAENVAKLHQQYRDAKGSEERAALLPAVENAEKLYDNATIRQQGKDQELVWKGKDKQLKALAQAYHDAETLEADIDAGRIVQPEEFKRKSPKINLNKGEKEARAEAARPAEVAEAKQRATAPETSGEKGVTRMVAAKARKPAKTVYSSKGLGQEGLSAEKEAIVKRAKNKIAEGKPLNAFDQRALAEARQAAATVKGMTLPVQTDEKVDIEAILRDIDVEFSKGVVENGLTANQLQKELDKAIGGAGITQSRVQVFDSVADFYKKERNAEYDYPDLPTDAKAFVDPKTGQAFMFANNIGKGDGLGVLLHEVGVHLGFRNLFNSAQYNALVKAAKNWAAKNDGSLESQVAKKAIARVEAAKTSVEQYNDELLAYTVEEAIKAGVSPSALKNGSPIKNWLSTVIDLLKKALTKFGLNANKLTAGDLVNLAYGAAQLEVRGTWHGSDATFKAFDTKYAGSGEGVYDRRFDGDNSLGAGPYVTPDKEYGEYYQHAIPFGKAAATTAYGKNSFGDYAEAIANDTLDTRAKSAVQLQRMHESNLLMRYLNSVSLSNGDLDPVKNKAAASYIQQQKEYVKQLKADAEETLASRQKRKVRADSIESAEETLRYANRLEKAINSLDVSKIKGLSERPPLGNLYRALDALPREKVYSVNSMAKFGERPAIDALLDKYGNESEKRLAEIDGEYPLNSLYYNIRRELGIEKTNALLKAAGIEAIEQKNDRKYTERAYLGGAPEILGMNLNPVGPAKDLLFSKKPQYDTDNALTELADTVVAQPKSFREKLGNNLALEAEMQLVDMRAGLREALKAGAKDLGDDKLFTQAMYNVQKADQHMPLVLASLSNGPLEFYTDDKGLRGVRSSDENSAKEIYDAVAKVPAKNAQGRMALATTYMIAQRAANKGLTALDLGALDVTEEKLKAAMDAANANPELKAALEEVRARYNAYNEGQIKFLAESGAIPKQLAKDLLKDGDYVPYYRVRDDGTAELVYGGEKTITIGDIRHQPYLQELKGGETKILPLNESIPRNTMLLVKKALTNLATKEIAYAMQAFGEGKGEIDPKTGKAKNLMPIHSGRSPGGSDVIVFNQEPDPNNPKDDGQRWLRVKTKDTAMEGIPAELVVDSLEGAHLTLPAFLKIGGFAGDLLRKGITRMPPYILRQLYRDPMAATFTSGLNYNPLTAVLKAGKEFIAMNRGTSEAGAELIKKGLIQSGIFTGDPSDISAFALQLASGKDQGAMDRLFAGLDRAAMRADASTRALVYKNAIENGLSEVEADQMVMESMNFYKRGLSPTVQYANRLIPFMNAQIQGLNVLYKAATGQMPFNERQEIQRKFFNNAMLLAATGVMYAMAMDDDKYFRNAKPRDKYSNFFVHLPGVDEPVKIAIPYEAGWFFSAGVATVDAMKAETDGKQQLKALRDMFLNAIPGYSSLYMPQAVKPIYEVWSNKNLFTGYNIESPTMQNKRIEDRYLSSTTEAAKFLSRMLPILSPVQIEHIAQAYFGALPLAVMAGTGDLFAKPSATPRPEARITDIPIIGSMFQKEFGGADTDVVYNLAKDVLQTQTSYGALKKSGTAEDIRAFALEHKPELAVAPMARAFESNMAKLRTQEDIITNRLNLSPAEKRTRIDAIEKIRADMATKFMNRIKQVEAQVGRTTPQ